MWEIIIQGVTSFLGALGFALTFNLQRRNILPASLGGLLAWLVYTPLETRCEDVFVPTVAASLSAALYSEILARTMKAPSNQYLVVGIIPLLPGSLLYHTFSTAFAGDMAAAGTYGSATALTALGIGAGISVVYGAVDIIRRVSQKKL